MTSASGQLQGGELNAAITSALVGIHHDHLGRGPRSASTIHQGSVVVTVMHDVMTRAETLLAATDQRAMAAMRVLLRQTMEAEYTAAVERLTGARVLACIGGSSTAPDVATDVFVLDRPLR